MPLFSPAQFQYHGPVPVTVDAVPLVHRLLVGVTVKVPLLLLPQVPLTNMLTLMVMLAVPPFPSEACTTKLSDPV